MVDETEIRTTPRPDARISWRAILAGALAALMIQLLLGVLGAAIGLEVADDGAGQPLAIGAAIYWFISIIVSLFAGGWVAAHMAALRRAVDGALHGFLNWSVVTTVAVVLTLTAFGNLVSGAMNLLGQVGGGLAQGVGEVASSMGDGRAGQTQQDGQQGQDDAWERIEATVAQVLRDEAPSGQGAQEGREATRQPKPAGDEPMQEAGYDEPSQPDDLSTDEVLALTRRYLQQPDRVLKAVDRSDLVEALQNNADMSRQEAERTVQEWEQLYREGRSELQETWRTIESETVEAAQATAEVGADVAWWTFAALLVGMLAALCGGLVGARTGGRYETYYRTTTVV